MSDYLVPLGISLLLTLILELVYALAVGIRGRDIVLICMINIITNPIAVLTVLVLRPSLRWIELPLEAVVVLVEWLILRTFSRRITKPFLTALGLNLFSYGVGILLNTIL